MEIKDILEEHGLAVRPVYNEELREKIRAGRLDMLQQTNHFPEPHKELDALSYCVERVLGRPTDYNMEDVPVEFESSEKPEDAPVQSGSDNREDVLVQPGSERNTESNPESVNSEDDSVQLVVDSIGSSVQSVSDDSGGALNLIEDIIQSGIDYWIQAPFDDIEDVENVPVELEDIEVQSLSTPDDAPIQTGSTENNQVQSGSVNVPDQSGNTIDTIPEDAPVSSGTDNPSQLENVNAEYAPIPSGSYLAIGNQGAGITYYPENPLKLSRKKIVGENQMAWKRRSGVKYTADFYQWKYEKSLSELIAQDAADAKATNRISYLDVSSPINKYPSFVVCIVCGFISKYKCSTCGAGFCSVTCDRIHFKDCILNRPR